MCNSIENGVQKKRKEIEKNVQAGWQLIFLQ
jgi:hypothetical protein